jgi:phage terminase small subunit
MSEKTKSKNLTNKQKAFCMLYAQGDMNASECARQAGFGSPSAQASRLLKNEAIVGEIQRHQKHLAIASGWDEPRVIAEASKLYARALEDGHLKTGLDVLTKIHDWLGMAQPKTVEHKHTHAFEDLLTRAREPRDITPRQDQLPN